jgi:hypothetical protein
MQSISGDFVKVKEQKALTKSHITGLLISNLEYIKTLLRNEKSEVMDDVDVPLVLHLLKNSIYYINLFKEELT